MGCHLTGSVEPKAVPPSAKAAWEVVQNKFVEDKQVAAVMAKHAARASHHPLPFTMSTVAACMSIVKGASVNVFPSAPSPLMVEHQLPAVSEIWDHRRWLRRKAQSCRNSRRLRFGNVELPTALGRSNEHEEEADAERDSGDVPCRTDFGTLLNVDEAFEMLRMLGMIADGSGRKDGLDVTDLASDFNRLLQTGICRLHVEDGWRIRPGLW